MPEASGKNIPDTDPSKWVDKYGNALYRYAVARVREQGDAEDLVQETFLAGLQSRQNFSGNSTVLTWLTGILKHKIVDYYRRTARRTTNPLQDEDSSDDTGFAFTENGHWKNEFAPIEWHNPHEELETAEFRAILMKCMDALPGRTARAFTLREMENLDSKEICEILGITPQNLWVILHRARFQLRDCLEKNWFEQRLTQ